MTTLPKPTTETTEKIRVALDWQAVASAAAFTMPRVSGVEAQMIDRKSHLGSRSSKRA